MKSSDENGESRREVVEVSADEDDNDEIPDGGEDDEPFEDDGLYQMVEVGRTFNEMVNDLMTEFLASLKFQMQFRC